MQVVTSTLTSTLTSTTVISPSPTWTYLTVTHTQTQPPPPPTPATQQLQEPIIDQVQSLVVLSSCLSDNDHYDVDNNNNYDI